MPTAMMQNITARITHKTLKLFPPKNIYNKIFEFVNQNVGYNTFDHLTQLSQY